MALGQQIDSVYIGSRGGPNLALPAENRILGRAFANSDENDHRISTIINGLGNREDTGNVTSQNCYITGGGSIGSRPPFNSCSGIYSRTAGSIVTSGYIVRQWLYQTFPNPSTGQVFGYILLSVKSPGVIYSMYYCSVTYGGGTVSNPTLFTNLRSINNSKRPHIVGFSKGLAYIKGFPDPATGEKLGTIIFDGSGGVPSYKPWGALGPTIAARITGWVGKLDVEASETAATMFVSSITAPPAAPFIMQVEFEQVNVTAVGGVGPYTFNVTRAQNGTKAAKHVIKTPVLYRDWAASDHQIEIPQSWEYSYGWKSITDNVTNRAAAETNVDQNPSQTGPFFNLKPKVTLQGLADTTNFPSVEVYRTTNGPGEAFYSLETVPNPGAGSFVYTDDSLGTGALGTTFNDPLPDTSLTQRSAAPSLTTNSPPPTVNPPLVVGVADPSFSTSNIETFQSRLWYAIDNVLYFSGDEEIKMGVPEECWPSGIAGNFIRFADKIMSIRATNTNLYAMGSTNTYLIGGTNKETFFSKIISRNTPAWPVSTASCAFENKVAFITADRRMCVINGEVIEATTDPICGIPQQSSGGISGLEDIGYQMCHFKNKQISWICILIPAFFTGFVTTPSQLLIYDWGRSSKERRDFWFAPWWVQASSIMAYSFGFEPGAGRLSVSLTNPSDPLGFIPIACGLAGLDIPNEFAGTPGTIGSDDVPTNAGTWSTGNPVFELRIDTVQNPAGNHLNAKALPENTTVMNIVSIDYRTDGAGVPNIGVYRDSDSVAQTAELTSIAYNPTRRAQSAGYISKDYTFYSVGQSFGLQISRGTIAPSSYLVIDRIAVGLLPAAGPDSAGQSNAG